jgi:hypothetical protein
MATGEYTDGKVKVTVKRAKLAAVTRDTTLQALVEQGLRQQLRGTK